MRFRAEHRFRAPVGAVADLLVDAAFHRELELPDVELLDVLLADGDGAAALLTLRYEYVGHLDPPAARLLGGRRLTWVQKVTVDRDAGTGRLSFAAEGNEDRLYGTAEFALRADDEETLWLLEGEVRVRVPLVGGAAERRVLAGMLRRLEIEAQQMAEELRARA
ncbi:MAG TPA: DUF2505 family protein [Acidimicrobiales bacterium]|nr:DUF2505 family protein [Acidimicrobiales bacterium]